MKNLIYICFLFPLISSALNFQGFLIIFMSDVIGLYLVYFNLALIVLGICFSINKTGVLSKTSAIWFFYYMLYFSFGFIAMVLFSNYTPILRTFIPFLYFIGFYMFLSIESQRDLFLKTATITSLAASLLLILFVILNFDMDYGGVSLYKIDRPGGVYGDANNAALASILSYLLFNKYFTANTPLKKYAKIVILLIITCSLLLTFSTTGISVFIIILFINNLNFFNREKIILLFVAVLMIFITILNLKDLTSGMDLTPGQRLKIDTLVNLITLNTNKINNSGRGDLLEHLFYYIYKNPFIGNGIDFSVNIRGHNTYFGIWADAGIFTFILFLIILVIYFKKTIKAAVEVKYFSLSILITLCIFMISLQTILNQPYLIVLFPYIGYLLDEQQLI